LIFSGFLVILLAAATYNYILSAVDTRGVRTGFNQGRVELLVFILIYSLWAALLELSVRLFEVLGKKMIFI